MNKNNIIKIIMIIIKVIINIIFTIAITIPSCYLPFLSILNGEPFLMLQDFCSPKEKHYFSNIKHTHTELGTFGIFEFFQ